MSQHFLLSKKARDFSLIKLLNWSDEDYFNFLKNIKFKDEDSRVCSECGAIKPPRFLKSRKQWRCRDCERSFSLFSGTVLANSKLTLRKIVLAMYLYSSETKGISMSQLSRDIDVSYKTAFTLLHKFKEAITQTEDLTPLKGHVQIDGGHFGGKPRSGQFRRVGKPEDIVAKIKLGKSQGAKRSRISRANLERKKRNRRIIINLRQLGPKGTGAVRTICRVAMAEDEKHVMSLIRRFVEPGTYIETDESSAYLQCSLGYKHETVQHSTEYSTIDGVNNNQAESFFSRMRRWEYGVSHRIEAKYMQDYANEFAWRENTRRYTQLEKLRCLAEKVLTSGLSRWWCGYWQGIKRNDEMLWKA